jgi:hypothetical protein
MTFDDPPAQICDLLQHHGRCPTGRSNATSTSVTTILATSRLNSSRSRNWLRIRAGGCSSGLVALAQYRHQSHQRGKSGSDWCFMLVSPAVQSGKGEQFLCIHEVRYGVIPIRLSRGVFSPPCLISLRYVERVERTCAVYRAAVAAV